MNQMSPPPKIEIIPASAPFSEAQRSWLNGFFAGLLTTDGPTPLSAEQGAAVLQGPAGDGDDGEAPWHDQTMPIADRMKLARRPPDATADDGGDGAAGLRPMRLQLPRLFRGDRQQGGSAAQSLRPRRQGNRADAEGAA